MSEFLGLLSLLKQNGQEFVTSINGEEITVKVTDIRGDLVTLKVKEDDRVYNLCYNQVIICGA